MAIGARAVRRACAASSGADRARRSASSRRPTTAACGEALPRGAAARRSASSIAARSATTSTRGRLDKTHASVLHQVRARRRAHHHPRARERPRRRAVLARCTRPATRCTSRASRTAFEGTPLGAGRVGRRAREPVAAVGERGRAQPRLLGALSIRSCSDVFPDQLGSVPLETFYRAINKVERSLIRTDADEVTYNLHVMLRFDLELELLEGRLAVKDLPEAWRARYRGGPRHRAARRPRRLPAGRALVRRRRRRRLSELHDRQYAQRAVLCRGAARASRDSAGDARGEFATLHGWLRENLYRHGRKFSAGEHRAARHRRADQHQALCRVPAQEVR